MLVTARQFFEAYYELEAGLKYLHLNGIEPEKSINYLVELRKTKRRLRIPCSSENKGLDENSPLIIPDTIQCGLSKIEKFVQLELSRINSELAEVVK